MAAVRGASNGRHTPRITDNNNNNTKKMFVLNKQPNSIIIQIIQLLKYVNMKGK